MKIVLFHIGTPTDPEIAEKRVAVEKTGWHQENILEVVVPGPRDAALLHLATVLEDTPEVSVIYAQANELFFEGSVESLTLHNVCVRQGVSIQTTEGIAAVPQFPHQ